MARDGYRFLAPLLGVSGILLYFGWIISGLVFLFLAAFVAFFFRDPDREIASDPNTIVSPADGKVIRMDPIEGGTRVSIFLSVFNVHVNRAPIGGKLTRVRYQPGKFLVAFDQRASVENEQMVFEIEGAKAVTFSLIAGLVARRIVPWCKQGDVVEKGGRIALIRFGSRVDIVIPKDCEVTVSNGEKVKAGVSILAHWRDDHGTAN